jgi:hypothetical protein
VTVRERDGVLSVSDPDDNVSYVIEPARHDLGLSRVGMVDFHLDDLAQTAHQVGKGDKGPWSDHIDALLDARAQFASEETS